MWPKPLAGHEWIFARRAEFAAEPDDVEPERFLVTSTPDNEPQRIVRYSPLATATGLFRHFAETTPDEAGILAFANAYGSLGGTIEENLRSETAPFPRLVGEAFSEWVRAIDQLRTVLSAWDAAKASDTAFLGRSIHWNEDTVYFLSDTTYERIGSSLDDPSMGMRFEEGDLLAPAQELVRRRVNTQLVDHRVAPRLLWNAGEEMDIRFNPVSLIGALWFQFARAIAGNKAFKQCQNCKNWIEVGGDRSARSDKKFCSPSCKAAFHRKNKTEGSAGVKHLAERE